MAVRTRKFNSTTVDANGNLHANGVGMAPRITSNDYEDLADKMMFKTIDSVHDQNHNRSITPQSVWDSIDVNGGSGTVVSPAYTGQVTVGAAPGSPPPITTRQKTTVRTSGSSGYEYEPFNAGPDFKIKSFSYDPFESRYESQVQSILDNILNKNSFDLKTDPNYQNLYDTYAQSYMQKGNRAMRDTMGNAAALTGGYGSTAAQIAGSQAYDTYLQGLNDQNLQLMNMAYGMYQDELADRYNQLSAVSNLDNTDYNRWADTRNFDYGVFNDQRNLEYNKWANDRDFRYNAWNNDRNFDYGSYTNDRTFDNTVEQQDYAKYQDAVNLALKYAQQGLPVPSYIAQQITDYTGTADINDVISAMPVSAGGSGGGGGRGGSGRGRSGGSSRGSSDGYRNLDNDYPYSTEVRRVADSLEKKKGNSERYYVIAKAYADGIIDDDQMNALLKDYGISERNALSDTNSAIGRKIQSVVTKSSMNQFEEDYKKKNNKTTLPTSLADIRKTFMY